jgi:hypothetical protein
MIGAHYYPWWGKPHHPVLGGGEWESGVAHHPILGRYSSRDPNIIKKHVRWAREAGIDFLAVEWAGLGSWEDHVLETVLAKRLGNLKFCIHYDSYLALHKLGKSISWDLNSPYTPSRSKGEKLIEDLLACRKYFKHPAYLRINNSPVVIVYAFREFKNASPYLERIKIKLRPEDPYFVADVVFWDSISPQEIFQALKLDSSSVPRLLWRRTRGKLGSKQMWEALKKYFCGVTGYCLYEPWRVRNFLENVERVYRNYYHKSKEGGLAFWPTVMPGYDDRQLRGRNRPILARNPQFYRSYWEVCDSLADDGIIIVTSFNEWHEGTEIEPSREFGETYLELTKELGR